MEKTVTFQDLFNAIDKDHWRTRDNKNLVELWGEEDLIDVLFGPCRIHDVEEANFEALDFRYHYVIDWSWLCTDEMAGYKLYTVKGQPFCAAYRSGRKYTYEYKFLCSKELLEEVKSCVKFKDQIEFFKLTDEIAN